MARYIDADALGIGKADRNAFEIPQYADGWNSAIEIIANAPTADVAPRAEWISVEDRLPDSGEHCLISCTVKRCDGTLGQYICVGYYAEKFKHLAYGVDDDCVSEYNEENDEYYIAEGWYEVIKNWDDYGFVAIDDFVTHWMPLPEPPQYEHVSLRLKERQQNE